MQKTDKEEKYKVVVNDFNISWFDYDTNKLHRNGGPALEHIDRYKHWYQHGRLHREDGPAVEYAHGPKEWYQNGQRHRLDGPAIEYYSGDKEWYYHGKLIDCKSQKEFNLYIASLAFKDAKPSLDGKIFEIDGAKYTLNLVAK
jgi:hypothetical protein